MGLFRHMALILVLFRHVADMVLFRHMLLILVLFRNAAINTHVASLAAI